MAVQGFGAGDFAALAKFAWKIYSNVRESRANFGKLNIDVECLLVSVGALDKGHTQDLITDYIDGEDSDSRELEIRALRDGLNSVIMPFYALFDSNTKNFKNADGTKYIRNKGGILMYVDGPTVDPVPPKERPWRRWQVTSWIQRLIVAFELKDLSELRSRFAVQAANLNLFLTRLTHMQLQRQSELLTLKLAEQSLLRNNFRYSLDLSEATEDFRDDVASYVRFLLDGGKPFTSSELQRRKAETRYSDASSKARRRAEKQKEQELMSRERMSKKKESDDDDPEASLDDDARLKLAAARQRLALAELKDDQLTVDPDALAEEFGQSQRAPVSSRRKSEPAEKVLTPRTGRAKDLPVRWADDSLVCDICDSAIHAEKVFYRCESGSCGRYDDTFDICRRCYQDDERCPGYEKGTCQSMSKVLWK